MHGNDDIADLMKAFENGNFKYARTQSTHNTPPSPPSNVARNLIGVPQAVQPADMRASYLSVGNTHTFNGPGATTARHSQSSSNQSWNGALRPIHEAACMEVHPRPASWQPHNHPLRNNPETTPVHAVEPDKYTSTTGAVEARLGDHKGMTFGISGKGFLKPANKAVVILQGSFIKADMTMVEECLDRMGFEHPVIEWQREECIPRQRAEQLIGGLCKGLAPGSNLLLIVAALTFNGIELSDKFLQENVYKPVANHNKTIAAERKKAMKQCKGRVFDARPYEGITLHVVLDGVKESLLPFALTFAASEGTHPKGLRTKWIKVPQPKKEDVVECSTKAGRIFQICSNNQCVQYQPGSVFVAFILANLKEAYLSYNVLAYRILDMVNHRFPVVEDAESTRQEQMQNTCSARMSEEVVLMPFQALAFAAMRYTSELLQKRAQDMLDVMRGGGDTVFCSTSQFDPNLSIAFNWNDAKIHLNMD